MKRTFILLTVFAIAMGFMETAIVIYLRELYYPGGFKFPLTIIPSSIALVEILREAATVIMLIAVGYLAGKNTFQRFCFFLFAFAVWDLFYYIFLKLFIGWPESLFTWDILFLIPMPWVGPVVAPCILSITMILMTVIMARRESKNIQHRVKRFEWFLLAAGSLIIITSFVWDYIFLASHSGSVMHAATGENFFTDVGSYVPQKFNWTLFVIGELSVIIGIIRVFGRQKLRIESR